ncbi:oligosaccharide flippase family protein [Pleomorphovibrio marinus]|uniref:oligosaccharide flippase family protein n=1 Tax=Pleomorphovibrio marinus TaxID=2164132 RepID=UPI000E0A9592|nr:oligosaccharide flippase family protein [Pleomorphovibrio marinus]
MKQYVFALCNNFLLLLKSGHERSVKAKKNILASFLIKGTSILISLMLVPMTINYVDSTRYGIWITLSSLIAWFSFFDIGFGHGLRNKLAESIAKNQFALAKKYVSTTYAILSAIIGIVLILFFLINPFLEWSTLLNTPPELSGQLSVLVLFVFTFFCLEFVLKLLTTILTANQEPAKGSLFNLLASCLSLIVIFTLTKTTSGSLIYLGIALSASPVIILLASSIYLYGGKYKAFAPNIKSIDFSLSRDLMGLGIKFFILQIGAIILFSTNNIIITQLFGPEQVTPYNIALKLFSVVTMGFGIVATPLWSAFTDAYVKNEIEWIKGTIKKLKMVWLAFLLASIVLLFLSPILYDLWIGDKVKIPFSLSLVMTLYVGATNFQTIYVFFLNGIGKIKLQLILVCVTALINIPLAIAMGKLFGTEGIVITNVIIYGTLGIVLSIQTKKIINKTAKGIWIR